MMETMRALVSLCLWLALSAAVTLAAAEASAPASAQIVALEWQKANAGLSSGYLSFSGRSAPFAKEPSAAKSGVVRGQLQFGGDSTNRIGCFWDRPDGKLYLDLNRNQDLTDDAEGIATAIGASNQITHQTFTPVRVSLKTASGVHPFLLEITLSSWGTDNPSYANVSLRSCWRGKVAWQGRDCEVALIEDVANLDGSRPASFLLLRPWEERTEPIVMARAFRLSSRLFWQNRACQVATRFEAQPGSDKAAIEFRPEQPKLGDLKVAGAFLQRIVLEDSRGLTVVLDQPAGTLKVPIGSYSVTDIQLKTGAAEANQSGGQRITVSETSPCSLLGGGPLTNSVAVSRSGRHLVLDYKLIGADGSSYSLRNDDRQNPPEFAIYQGTKKVFSGKFAFG
jgi:hypothetical protein